MAVFMKPYAPQTYALLRIITGAMFILHGTQKLVNWPGSPPAEAPAFVLYTAGPIEVIGGALVMIGLRTRWAAFICSGTMAFAYWLAHGTKHLLPILNRGELAVIYCFVFLYIAANGSGIWSVDGARGEN